MGSSTLSTRQHSKQKFHFLRIWTRLVCARLVLSLAAISGSTFSLQGQCGGVIFLAYNPAPTPSNAIYLQVIIEPFAAVQAGAGWRLKGETTYHSDSNYSVKITNSVPQIEFNTNTPGWDPPTITSVMLTNQINVISNVPYLRPSSLYVDPSNGLNSSGPEGGPFNPTSIMYTVANLGETVCGMLWNINNQTSWLSVSRTNGFLAAGDSTNITVTINTNANTLPAGNDAAALSFVNLSTGVSNTLRFVFLNINALPPTLNGLHVLSDGNFAMTLQGVPNHIYGIQLSSNLVNWADVLNLTNTHASTVFTSPPAVGSAQGFYRAKE